MYGFGEGGFGSVGASGFGASVFVIGLTHLWENPCCYCCNDYMWRSSRSRSDHRHRCRRGHEHVVSRQAASSS